MIGEAQFVNRQLDPNTNREIRWMLPDLFSTGFARLSPTELGERLPGHYLTLAEWHWSHGRHREQRAYGDSALALDPASPFALAHAGKLDQASAAAGALLDQRVLGRDFRDYPQFLHGIARLYAMLGETEAALNRLDQWSRMPSERSVAMLRFDPAWIPIRDDPRFQRIAPSP